jgi:hypothetical protein
LKNKIVIGIPTILRNGKADHLIETVRRIYQSINGTQRDMVEIFIMIAESNSYHAAQLRNAILDNFKQELERGSLIIFRPPEELYYPISSPCELSRTFEDGLLRVRWRSKQVLFIPYII